MRHPLAPRVFTPYQGLMALAERATRALEARTGLQLWDGESGLGSVCAQKLRELKVPVHPIKLAGDTGALTPRAVAEQTGFVRRKRVRRFSR